MRALKAIAVDDMDTDVPAAAIPLIPQLKHQVRDLVRELLNGSLARAGSSPSPAKVRAAVASTLKAGGVTLGSGGADPPYGPFDVAVLPVPGHRELLAVLVTLSVRCGDDGSIYLFEREGRSGGSRLRSRATTTRTCQVRWGASRSRFLRREAKAGRSWSPSTRCPGVRRRGGPFVIGRCARGATPIGLECW
jgi:hypothetical protein